jgi:hypothetical protein
MCRYYQTSPQIYPALTTLESEPRTRHMPREMSMRNSQPLVPEHDATVHMVLDDSGELGRVCVETDEAQADQGAVVDNLLTGQYRKPVRVVATNTAEGWDVSKDIAREVVRRIQAERRTVTPGTLAFLVLHLESVEAGDAKASP